MPEAVRAKFRVHNVHTSDWGTHVEMSPVYAGSEENRAFFHATPNGSISLMIKNETAAKYFRPNQELYVDFTEPEPAAVGSGG